MTHKSDPIESRFLDSRDLFALRFQEGIVPLEVDEWEDTEYEEFSNLEDIEGGTSLDDGFQRIEDSSSDDLLFVPSDEEMTVMHVGIGISPSIIEGFVSYPEDSRDMGRLPDLSTNPTPGNNIGGFSGEDSPYRQPTRKSELVIPPKQNISMNFHNPGNDAHEPLLKFVYRKYRVNVLDPNRDKNAISRITKAGSPAPIFTVGNYTSKAEYNLSGEWNVEPKPRDQLTGGGRR